MAHNPSVLKIHGTAKANRQPSSHEGLLNNDRHQSLQSLAPVAKNGLSLKFQANWSQTCRNYSEFCPIKNVNQSLKAHSEERHMPHHFVCNKESGEG